MKRTILIAALAAMAGLSTAQAGETPSMEGAKVYFGNLKDGDTVKGPVKVIFGVTGMGVAPAGTEAEGTGHHHLLVNRAPFLEGEDGKEEAELNIPADENHKHYGKGQTETVLDLKPGTHTLQMVFGDMNHIPHNPPLYTSVITITVE